jgi:hypothetical protein
MIQSTSPKKKFKKRNKKIVLLGIILSSVLMIALGLLLTSPRCWKRIGSSVILKDGLPLDNATMYSSRNGNLLLRLEEGKKQQLYMSSYIVIPKDKKVEWVFSNFLAVPGFVFGVDAPLRSLPMPSSKIEVNPNLIIRDKYLEFTSQENVRITATW